MISKAAFLVCAFALIFTSIKANSNAGNSSLVVAGIDNATVQDVDSTTSLIQTQHSQFLSTTSANEESNESIHKEVNCTALNPSQIASTSECNSTSNSTSKPETNGFLTNIGITEENMDMYLRAFYVVIGVTAVVLIYLGVKTYLVRRRKGKARKYGVLTDRHLEMNTHDDDEEDELFDQSRRRLINN